MNVRRENVLRYRAAYYNYNYNNVLMYVTSLKSGLTDKQQEDKKSETRTDPGEVKASK